MGLGGQPSLQAVRYALRQYIPDSVTINQSINSGASLPHPPSPLFVPPAPPLSLPRARGCTSWRVLERQWTGPRAPSTSHVLTCTGRFFFGCVFLGGRGGGCWELVGTDRGRHFHPRVGLSNVRVWGASPELTQQNPNCVNTSSCTSAVQH